MSDKELNAIPEPTLKRLSRYYQYLSGKAEQGQTMISATEISNDLSLTSIQVRKDLQISGALGKPKVGYEIKELTVIVGKSLGYDSINEAFLVGVGNFGQLILNYKGFTEYGFKILAAFEKNPLKVGMTVGGVKVLHINKFEDLVKRMKVKIGIIAVNSENAQEIADMMVKAKIEAVWNLTHTHIDLPKEVINVDVNLGSSLSVLLSKLNQKYKTE